MARDMKRIQQQALPNRIFEGRRHTHEEIDTVGPMQDERRWIYGKAAGPAGPTRHLRRNMTIKHV